MHLEHDMLSSSPSSVETQAILSIEWLQQRAFALDSRTVWVEQQITLNGIVSRDNLYVSPMDYDPHKPERHVPVTTISRPSTVDSFHPYKGNLGGTGGQTKRGTKTASKKKKKKKKNAYNDSLGDIRGSLGYDAKTEFISPFADHDKRVPFDPSRRYHVTDRPSLPVDPFLHSRLHDGVRRPAQLGSCMSTDKFARLPPKEAAPEYDPKYDSYVLRKRPILGLLSEPFVLFCCVICDLLGKFRKEPTYQKDREEREKRIRETSNDKLQKKAVVIPEKPPLKTRKQPEIVYDASCYERNKKEGAITMTPAVTKAKARVNVFQSAIQNKVEYKSKNIESPIAERVRRNFM